MYLYFTHFSPLHFPYFIEQPAHKGSTCSEGLGAQGFGVHDFVLKRAPILTEIEVKIQKTENRPTYSDFGI